MGMKGMAMLMGLAAMGMGSFPYASSADSGEDIANDGRKWPSNPTPIIVDKEFTFTVGNKTFTCMAKDKKLAIAKFNAWKRENKLK